MNDKDVESVYVEFHERAKRIFFALYRKFESASTTVDRKKKEYLFQQIKETYVLALKQGLENLAKEVLKEQQNHKQLQEIDKALNHFITEYLHQFVQKTRSL